MQLDDAPIIVGQGEVTQRPDTERPREPLALMADAARLAARDAGNEDLLQSIDSLRVINVLSWPSKAPAQDLARALAVAPRELIYTAVGGNTPQWQVNEVAQGIVDGEIKLALITGAEAMYSARRARTKGIDLGWSHRGTPETNAGSMRAGTSDAEAKHAASIPTSVYPLFENALRAHYGRTIEEHQHAIGAMMAKFSEVASQNEHAWFKQARSGGEIATPGPDNRYIGFPYPKYMNAIMDVDQGGDLLMTSVAEARRLGIAEDRWIYLWGCGDAADHWFITERVNYHSSPAMKANMASAMLMAGVTLDDIACFDLYSCFPSAVQIARDSLELAADDTRPLTVTGGLPYFGGPGNNYVTHSIAAMVRKLRDERGKVGLVTANGWYVTKHATGIYSSEPPRNGWNRTDANADQAKIDAEPHPEVIEAPAGNATVETYTVLFDRDGAPTKGIIIGRTADGARFIANAPEERRTLESMTKHEMVGAPGRVGQAEDGRNVFVPA